MKTGFINYLIEIHNTEDTFMIIKICVFCVKKMLSCSMRPTSASDHVMWFKEVGVEWGSLKTMSANTEMHCSYNCHLVYTGWCVSVGQ